MEPGNKVNLAKATGVEPLPCPFCGCGEIEGGTACHDRGGEFCFAWIGCSECAVTIEVYLPERWWLSQDHSPPDFLALVEAWNRRITPAASGSSSPARPAS